MQNNKGLTLVEIVVAMALLGIIAVTFLGALSSHYVFISNTKEITEDVFTAQKDVEEQIKTIKANISEGNSVPGGNQIELFGRVVKGYPIEADINDSKLIKTVVADSRMPSFTAPVASNLKLELYIDNTKLTRKHEYAIKPGLNIRASADVDKKGVFLLNKHEWYVSKPGIHIPIVSTVNIDENLDYGRLYPLFSNDYEAIPILTESNMMNSSKLQQIRDDYKGRHIIYTITPYAESGKKGKTILSEPVYLSGLPDLDNLILHLDASLISKEDTNAVRTESEQVYVKQWADQSGQNNHLSNNTNNFQPILQEVQYQEEAFVWGKSLAPNAGNALMNTTNFTPNEATRNMIFIIVAKGNVQNTSTNILRGTSSSNSWFFGWGIDQRLQFGRINDNSDTYASLDAGAGLNGKWHVFTGIATQSGGSNGGLLSLRIDGEELGTTGTFTGQLRHNDGLAINWKDIEIAELLIYRNQKSTHELNAIETYLIDKYNPEPEITDMKIISLRPIPSTKVYLNDTFTLPQTVYANMSNGTIQSVGVTWSNPINTDTPGLKTATATAVMEPTKTLTLSVYVMSVSRLKALNPVTINHGENYPLPDRITAVMTNGDEEKVDVRWSSKTNVLDVGTHTLTATFVGDNTKTVNLTVHVQPITVTGVSLHENNLLLPKDSEAMLYASVEPSNASNKSLVWASSDPSIATVDNDGRVKGVGEGIANISVKTVDGGFIDVCQVTVFISATSVQLNKSSTQLRINDQEQLMVIPNPVDAAIDIIEWSSSNTSVVEVDQTGIITAKSAGNAIITATVHTPGGSLTTTCQVNVTQVTATDYQVVEYTRTGFLYYTLSANINIILSDDTVYRHPVRISGSGLFMSSYTTTIEGNAFAESTRETVPYSMRVTIP